MMTVNEVAELAHVSVRTLHHYDQIGLLKPSKRTDAGYRLYGETDLDRLQQIMLFRELEFPLKEIAAIIDSSGFDRSHALEQQIELLELKRERIENLIDLAKGIKAMESSKPTFDAFDTSKLDEYARQAKASWGTTDAWKEYEKNSAKRSRQQEETMGQELLDLFKPFGEMASEGVDPASPEAIDQARAIQSFISESFYTCTDEIFLGLGQMYGNGGDFTRNINAHAGEGAAEFAMHAIEAYAVSAS